MRHRRRGRKLGRSPKHQRAVLRNLATALILTERDAEEDDNKPKVKGRIVTTLHKAKEVRPLVERCVTIACRALPHQEAADELEPDADRGSEKWRAWRDSKKWYQWNQAVAPAVAARRRVLRMLGNKEAVRILFDEIAPRFADRDGGYTRILQLATPRLGDAGVRAILEFVGTHDRVRKKKAAKPRFEDETEEEAEADETDEIDEDEEEAADQPTAEPPMDAADEASAEDAPDEQASDEKTSKKKRSSKKKTSDEGKK